MSRVTRREPAARIWLTLCAAGIDAEWVHRPGPGDLAAGEVVVEMYGTTTIPLRGVTELSRTLQIRPSELDRYLNRANRARAPGLKA